MNIPLIFDIKKYAINDGPGIRLTIFLKGCNLNCVWCHNPEGISPEIEKMYSKTKCIGCNTCVEACSQDACKLTPNGIVTDVELCKMCGKCAEVCPTGATEMSGEEKTMEELLEIIEEERIFFDQSKGGVTISGGEPLMHHEFVLELLDECRTRGIHTAVDTSGYASSAIFLKLAEKTDLILYDLKLIDTKKHEYWTGIGNEAILENLKLLARTGAEINIRIPLIKGVNDDEVSITSIAKFILSLDGKKKSINLLPYHNIAKSKYEKLGKIFENENLGEPSVQEQENIVQQFSKYGLKAAIGG